MVTLESSPHRHTVGTADADALTMVLLVAVVGVLLMELMGIYRNKCGGGSTDNSAIHRRQNYQR